LTIQAPHKKQNLSSIIIIALKKIPEMKV